MSSRRIAIALCLALSMACGASAAKPIVVGSKRFTESYILAEIVRQTLQRQGIDAVHEQGLGNTGILEQALESGSIDVYPEYTGTIVRELLKREGHPTLAQLNEWLAPRGLKAVVPLGFNDGYALAMREALAARLGIARLSDLREPKAAGLRLGLSHEFLARGDGWPALKAAYDLPQQTPLGIDHGIAYEAIADDRVDVIDIYTTDAKLARYGLRVLRDDLGFFPKYDAVLLMRRSVDETPLLGLAGRIDERSMIRMNAEVELDGLSFREAARRFLEGASALARPAAQTLWQRTFADDFARLAVQHLLLVLGSVVLAVLVGVPVGAAAWRWPRSAGPLLGLVGVLQTIPSIALLAFLIAVIGRIGVVPAVLALFVYALLPIVRNTHAGLAGVRPGLRDAATSLGLTRWQCLRLVQLPLAMPTVLAGVKTAAVISVGTATIAAFIGAGGFGERIVAGLAVNDTNAMLSGALPAAALALAVQGLFGLAERWWRPGAR